MEDVAEHYGNFESYDAIEKCNTSRFPGQPEDISQELKAAVQTGKFRPYGKLFLTLRARNLRCKYPRSEEELKDEFLTNMRNNQLRMILLSVPGDVSDLVAFAEDLISKGHIFDYNDPRAKRRSTRGRNQNRRNFKGNNNNRRFN